MSVSPIFNTPMAQASAYASANNAAVAGLFASSTPGTSSSGIPGAPDSVQWSNTALEAANFLALASTLDTMRVGSVATESLVAKNINLGQSPSAPPSGA